MENQYEFLSHQLSHDFSELKLSYVQCTITEGYRNK